MNEEAKKLRGALIGYLGCKGHDTSILKLDLLELIRLAAVEHAKESGMNIVVSYHREEDLK